MNELTQINTKYFELTPTSLKISEDTPLDEWKKAGLFLKQAEGAIQFWIGDWINFGEKKYGKIKELSEEQSDYSYGTLRDFASVAGRLSSRNDNLSFKHHKTVSPLEPPQQKEWLDKAEKNDWSVSELRKAIQIEHRNVKTLEESVQGKFPVIYADPPWSYSNSGFKGSAAEHYPTMTTEDICAMNIPSTENAVLFLWVTNPLLEDAMQVVNAWGFEYKTNFVWVKDKATHLGFYCFGKHELLFIATKGSMLPKQEGMVNSVVEAVRTEHSKKPEMVYEMIEAMYDAPYLELFARQSRQGWSSFGNEL